MFAKPTEQHQFFAPLAGEWSMEHRCDMGNGQPQVVAKGRVTGRSLKGMWCLLECFGDPTEQHPESWGSLFTLGFDSTKSAFVGTFIGSMMNNLWLYEGQLDSSGKVLVLNTTGPKCDGTGTASYRDKFEVVNDNLWILRSEVLEDSGTWKQFLEGHHHRIG